MEKRRRFSSLEMGLVRAAVTLFALLRARQGSFAREKQHLNNMSNRHTSSARQPSVYAHTSSVHSPHPGESAQIFLSSLSFISISPLSLSRLVKCAHTEYQRLCLLSCRQAGRVQNTALDFTRRYMLAKHFQKMQCFVKKIVRTLQRISQA